LGAAPFPAYPAVELGGDCLPDSPYYVLLSFWLMWPVLGFETTTNHMSGAKNGRFLPALPCRIQLIKVLLTNWTEADASFHFLAIQRLATPFARKWQLSKGTKSATLSSILLCVALPRLRWLSGQSLFAVPTDVIPFVYCTAGRIGATDSPGTWDISHVDSESKTFCRIIRPPSVVKY
jgi:hypothetical protein